MTEALPEVPTRLYFSPELEAPFGELNLVRIDYKKPHDKSPDGALTTMAGGVIKEAWLNSPWLHAAIGMKAAIDLEDDARPPFAINATVSAIDSFHYPASHVTWFAVRPQTFVESRRIIPPLNGLQKGGLYPEQVLGFASAKHDVSGNWFQQYIKRNRYREKVYAAVSDVDVLTAQQGKKIGGALLYAALSAFSPEQVPTTYVFAENTALIKKLGILSFQPTGSRARTGLVSERQLEEVRLQATSIKLVRERLLERMPWLDEAKVISSVPATKK